MNRKEVLAYLGLTLMTTIIGFSFIFVKIALRSSSPIDLLAHRFSVAAVTLFLYYLVIKRQLPRYSRSALPQLIVLSLFYPIVLFLLQTVGLQYTTASEAGIISAVAPIITVILASIILKEKNSLMQNLSVLFSVVGVVYIMYHNGLGNRSVDTLKGDIFIFLSVVSMSLYFVLGRRVTQSVNAMDVTFFMTLSASLLFNIVSLSMHINDGTVTAYFASFANREFFWSILYLGVLSSFLTSFLTNNALAVIPASQVSIFNNFSPVIAIFGGVLFLNETLYIYQIVGGIMVVIGILGVNILKKR